MKPGTPYLGTRYGFESCLHPSELGEAPFSFEKNARFAGYLLFNSILGDERPASGNVLTQAEFDALLALHASTAAPEALLRVVRRSLPWGDAFEAGECDVATLRMT